MCLKIEDSHDQLSRAESDYDMETALFSDFPEPSDKAARADAPAFHPQLKILCRFQRCMHAVQRLLTGLKISPAVADDAAPKATNFRLVLHTAPCLLDTAIETCQTAKQCTIKPELLESTSSPQRPLISDPEPTYSLHRSSFFFVYPILY